MFFLSDMLNRKLKLPKPEEALPGRAQAIPTAARHAVSGRPLKGPYPEGHETAYLAMGCFWGAERLFWQTPGVWVTAVGYQGGVTPNPTYQETCTGMTGHAEVVQVTFDPARITYAALCDWFFRSHDPTTLNRQGADVGTQYRSVIFFRDAEQHQQALAAIDRAQPQWPDPIVTEVVPAVKFWPAEAYHQDYFRNNPTKGYCRAVIAPKLEKLGLPTRSR